MTVEQITQRQGALILRIAQEAEALHQARHAHEQAGLDVRQAELRLEALRDEMIQLSGRLQGWQDAQAVVVGDDPDTGETNAD